MKVRITHLKAPWPAGAKPGDVVELAVDAVPEWALGKCKPIPDDTPTAAEVAEALAKAEAQAEALAKAEAEAAAAAAKAALVEEAKTMGVKVDGRWSDERLAEEIAKAKAAQG